MGTILITGGCGYIGSHTAFYFLQNTDKNLIILDNLSTGFKENFDYLSQNFPNRISLIYQDLGDRAKLEELFKSSDIECILHFAAALSVEESTKNPLLYYTNNTFNTLILIQTCIKYQVKNFIFSSTAAVYGDIKIADSGITEDFSPAPINPYGASKMMSEKILQDISKRENFNAIILRYFNVAGASMQNQNLTTNGGLGQRSKNATHLIKVALECATGKREKMAIFGTNYLTPDGTCIRDYIHIDDLASAHFYSYKYLVKNQNTEIFNVGYSKGYSVSEVIAMVKKVTGSDFRVEIQDSRPGDPAKLIANNHKILKKTSWNPKYNDLSTIIKSAYDWEKYL